jgi:xylulokinase
MVAALLGIDIGTSSTKGVLATERGRVLATVTRPHKTAMPRPGWAEHDADTVWWADVREVARALLTSADGQVSGVCVSGIGPCLLVADADGRPLRPAILYGIDTRATTEIAELTGRLGADAILSRCGSPLTSQAVGPKLLWLSRHEPAIWSASRRMFMASSYAVWRLTGEYVLDHHSASQCDPMYALAAGRWAQDWATELAGPIELPPLRWPGQVAGHVTPRAAAETGIPAGTPVATGTIDAWSEAVSAGVRDPGEYMVMFGTTMFFIATSERPLANRRLWSTAGAFPATWTLAGGMAASGALVAWGSDLTGVGYRRLMAEAAAVPPGADGLLVLPYFAGERTPIFDAQARGTIFGLTLRHGRAHLFRAFLEATAFGARHNLEAIADAGARLEHGVAVGGGTASQVWPQIVADVTGRELYVPAVTVGAAYGDAFLAGVAVGQADPGARWARTKTVITPDPAAADRYAGLYALYREAYDSTAVISHSLAALQEPPEGPVTMA